MKRIHFIALLAGAAIACSTLPASAQPASDFFAGKQINVIVGAGVGGGYDLQARLVARHLPKHIPGNPSTIVQDMPAAGGIAATNYIYNTAPRDGTVIAFVQRGMLLAKLTYPGAVRFDIEKLNWLASLASEVSVTVAWHTDPHKTAQDLFDKELIVGAISGVDPETTPKLYNSLLGTRFKIVTGYNSTAQIALAIERGEVAGIGDWSWSSLKVMRPEWVRDKKVTPLLQGALRKEPELPGVPNALDLVKNPDDRRVLELYYTQKTAARPVIAPPGVPAERIAILRRAFTALATDPEFLAEAERSRIEVEPMPGEEVDKIVRLIASTPPELAQRFVEAFGQAR